MSRNVWSVLVIFTCLLVCPVRIHGFSWNIFSSSSSSAPTGGGRAPAMELVDGTVADFALEGANDPRGLKLLENARNKLAGPSNCWQDAYRKLFASCGEIMADKERQSRLAWHLSSCFQEDSGQPPFPSCVERSKMAHCRNRLTESESKVFLEFFLETNTLCHQLQAEAFKHNTERLINDLTSTSRSAEEKLKVIEERSGQIIQESGEVKDALSSIKLQADSLAEASEHAGEQMRDVLNHSKSIFDKSKEIADAQAELSRGQSEMKEKIEAGMARVEDKYVELENGMDKLREETGYMKSEIKNVSESMSSKMKNLQNAADDIGRAADKSLENQNQLLDGQTRAMDGLIKLRSSQEKALEENRDTIQKLAQFGQRQQEELLSRQEEIRQAHEHLILNSQSILEAQEEFRAKQANIFAALDKLYVLHNAILAESRFIKAFFFYCCIVFLVYMLTSAKQTFGIRGHLYFGLCVTLMLEIGLIRIGADDFDRQFWVMSKVFLVRMAFLGAATVHILHSIFTYRDYEVLNHWLLQTLVEKVRALEENVVGGRAALSYGSESEEEESLRNYSWVFDELADEVDSKVDPTYVLPSPPTRSRRDLAVVMAEEIGENSIMTSASRKYNLRPRK